jgi:hypothetical protein
MLLTLPIHSEQDPNLQHLKLLQTHGEVEVEVVDKEPRLEGRMRLRRVAMGKMWAKMELHLAWSSEVWMEAAAEETEYC